MIIPWSVKILYSFHIWSYRKWAIWFLLINIVKWLDSLHFSYTSTKKEINKDGFMYNQIYRYICSDIEMESDDQKVKKYNRKYR